MSDEQGDFVERVRRFSKWLTFGDNGIKELDQTT